MPTQKIGHSPLKGRKFYGAFNVTTGEYWVCVQLRDGDAPEALGFEEGTLAGGRYARERLEGVPPAVYGPVKPTFDRLAEQHPDEDVSRPSIEFYRRQDVIDLLLPVA
jgi:DNA gyrase inhibitor GyrI